MNGITLEEALVVGRGVERPFLCPSHGDTRASASVNVLKKVWYCHVCGESGRVGKGSIADDMKAALAAMAAPDTVRTYDESWLDIFDSDHESSYWANRVGAATAFTYRAGTHPYLGLPTYPIRDRVGRVLGVVMRLPVTQGRKYDYPVGVPVSQCMFGYDIVQADPTTTVVVVEGAGDVMAAHAAGFTCVVGSYGCGLHAPQVQMLAALHPQRVVVAYDNDQAGQRGAARAVDALTEAKIPAVIHGWRDESGNDFGSMSTSQIAAELHPYGLVPPQHKSAASAADVA